mgnify:CR=1 FL=1
MKFVEITGETLTQIINDDEVIATILDPDDILAV